MVKELLEYADVKVVHVDDIIADTIEHQDSNKNFYIAEVLVEEEEDIVIMETYHTDILPITEANDVK